MRTLSTRSWRAQDCRASWQILRNSHSPWFLGSLLALWSLSQSKGRKTFTGNKKKREQLLRFADLKLPAIALKYTTVPVFVHILIQAVLLLLSRMTSKQFSIDHVIADNTTSPCQTEWGSNPQAWGDQYSKHSQTLEHHSVSRQPGNNSEGKSYYDLGRSRKLPISFSLGTGKPLSLKGAGTSSWCVPPKHCSWAVPCSTSCTTDDL